ncbi:site-specific recombinase [Microtetraspora sp. NBRC 13810]|uniref:site-specific recombinase n=1 Tax=Microtetraspora sp. NBRC 13810 TaxID=3030990 RepID=UPI0025574BDE|nr:site-specific recombinase [Microtetraspora sp. NBRC 13810]
MAIDRYLETLRLSPASRRVYRIALATWAWPLVGRTPPGGRERRGAPPPIVPLALLDTPAARDRLREALAERAAAVDARTLGRELSILRGAVGWWRNRGWISGDPVGPLRSPALPATSGEILSGEQVAEIFRLPAGLREQTFWRLLYETAAPVERLLALNVDDLDLPRRRLRRAPAIRWRAGAARLLPLLLLGRGTGPVLLTERRAARATPPGDRDPVTGRGRLSYRRAAELFTGATRPLDPAGHGWTLRHLRAAGQAHRPSSQAHRRSAQASPA